MGRISEYEQCKRMARDVLQALQALPEDKALQYSWMIRGAAVVSNEVRERNKNQTIVSTNSKNHDR